DLDQGVRIVEAALAGVDADAPPAVAQALKRPGRGDLLPGQGGGGRRRDVEVTGFDQQVVRDDHRGRAGFAAAGQGERLLDRAGDVAGVLDREDALGHRLEQLDLAERVHL